MLLATGVLVRHHRAVGSISRVAAHRRRAGAQAKDVFETRGLRVAGRGQGPAVGAHGLRARAPRHTRPRARAEAAWLVHRVDLFGHPNWNVGEKGVAVDCLMLMMLTAKYENDDTAAEMFPSATTASPSTDQVPPGLAL